MARTLDSTPRKDGFQMPGEFEAHTGCWMLWPERPDNWRLGAKPAQKAFVAVATAISRFEPVTMGVSSAQFLNARRTLPAEVRVVEMTYNDAWVRDCGPTFVVNDRDLVRGVDWEFNAWGGLNGGLYFPWDQDNRVARKVLEIERLDRYKADFVLEGGSIHVDGQGTLVTTEECLLNSNRNPRLSRTEIEEKLQEYLNIEKVIWLGRGVYQDETSGHVDNLCCFVHPGVLALTWTDDPADPQFESSHDAYERLSMATDALGRRLEIHKIHQPGPLYATAEEGLGVDDIEGVAPRPAGRRLPGSYINFYIANRGVIMPIFDDPHDQLAQQEIQNLFPDREILGLPGREILLGGGNIHCITQQQPDGTR